MVVEGEAHFHQCRAFKNMESSPIHEENIQKDTPFLEYIFLNICHRSPLWKEVKASVSLQAVIIGYCLQHQLIASRVNKPTCYIFDLTLLQKTWPHQERPQSVPDSKGANIAEKQPFVIKATASSNPSTEQVNRLQRSPALQNRKPPSHTVHLEAELKNQVLEFQFGHPQSFLEGPGPPPNSFGGKRFFLHKKYIYTIFG